MRKILVFVTTFVVMSYGFAQSPLDSVKIEFLTNGADGGFTSTNTQGFYVLGYEGQSAAQLYTNVLSAVYSMYKDPKKVISEIHNTFITISGFAIDVPVPKEKSEISTVFPLKNDYYAFDYTLKFQFKDEKIRVNAPALDAENILFMDVFQGEYRKVALGFAGMHLGRRDDKICVHFEKYINSLINNILKKAESINDW